MNIIKPSGGIAKAFSIGAITSMIGLSATYATQPHQNYNFAQRAAMQQRHMDEGVRSGALTKAEANHITRYESNLASRVKSDRAANGTLTASQRRDIVKAQNAAGRRIHQLKNNQYTRGELDKTADRQQRHVQEGIQSGQLTKSEAAEIKSHEQNVLSQVQSARQADGGTLSATDRKRAEKAQQDAARHIYDLKHNQDTPGQQQ